MISWHTFSDAIRFVAGRVTIVFICAGAIAIKYRGPIYDPGPSPSLGASRPGRRPQTEGSVAEGRQSATASMLRARIPISRNSDGLWQVGQSLVEIDGRQIGLATLAPQPTTDEVIEEMMGRALLCFDQNGRRGTSEQIQWNITIDEVPHCYRCIEPMQPIAPREDPARDRPARTWKCSLCKATIEL